MKAVGMFAMAALALAAGCCSTRDFAKHEPVKVILDTDMISDYDDMGALACLHALAKRGECVFIASWQQRGVIE